MDIKAPGRDVSLIKAAREWLNTGRDGEDPLQVRCARPRQRHRGVRRPPPCRSSASWPIYPPLNGARTKHQTNLLLGFDDSEEYSSDGDDEEAVKQRHRHSAEHLL